MNWELLEFMKLINSNDELERIINRFYGSDREIQIGDEIIFGFINMYSNIYGYPQNQYPTNSPNLSLQSFVKPKGEDVIYQLYSKD